LIDKRVSTVNKNTALLVNLWV